MPPSLAVRVARSRVKYNLGSGDPRPCSGAVCEATPDGCEAVFRPLPAPNSRKSPFRTCPDAWRPRSRRPGPGREGVAGRMVGKVELRSTQSLLGVAGNQHIEPAGVGDGGQQVGIDGLVAALG